MVLLPFFFGFIFALLLIYKLVGGNIDWIYVIISGALTLSSPKTPAKLLPLR
jgi:hypothetical protein